jgi:hypothetical protein
MPAPQYSQGEKDRQTRDAVARLDIIRGSVRTAFGEGATSTALPSRRNRLITLVSATEPSENLGGPVFRPTGRSFRGRIELGGSGRRGAAGAVRPHRILPAEAGSEAHRLGSPVPAHICVLERDESIRQLG